MKKLFILIGLIALISLSVTDLKAGPPMGREFGLGLMAGEPTGITAKIWTKSNTAFAISLGNSYLGKYRFGLDYLWHTNAFNSQVIGLYFGPGVAIGVGESGGWWYSKNGKTWYKEESDIGIGVRGLLGINIIPRNTPLEFFAEIGLMVGVNPSTSVNTEGAIGFRYYF
jgi:hypothetical protein